MAHSNRARRARVLGVEHDATQLREILSCCAALWAAVEGSYPSRWIPRAGTRAAGASATELCAADRAALRHLPHRLCRTDPIRPSFQDRGLYLWRRRLSHGFVS